MTMPHVASISIYPIKSFGPAQVPSARIVDGGGLEHDREFALFDSAGKFINGKRNPKVYQLTAAVDWKDAVVYLKPLGSSGDPVGFSIRGEVGPLEAWLSRYFDEPVSWRRNSRGGFPDDTQAPGPTIVSDATYGEVESWYGGLSVGEIRKRFRANIEISCAEPFWEDRLYAGAGQVRKFRVGEVELHGVNPCKRCIVPTRHTVGGEAYPEFANIFMVRRSETLPAWAERSRFDHYYRLAVNTRVPVSETGKKICVGDTIEIQDVE